MMELSETERARWREFGRGSRERTPPSVKAKVIEMSREGASLNQIKQSVKIATDKVNEIRMKARRQGLW